MTTIIITILVVLGAISGWNIVIAARKAKAAAIYGINYTPAVTDYLVAKYKEQRSEAKVILAEEGKHMERVGEVYAKKAIADSKRTFDPLTEASKKRAVELEDKYNSLI